MQYEQYLKKQQQRTTSLQTICCCNLRTTNAQHILVLRSGYMPPRMPHLPGRGRCSTAQYYQIYYVQCFPVCRDGQAPCSRDLKNYRPRRVIYTQQCLNLCHFHLNVQFIYTRLSNNIISALNLTLLNTTIYEPIYATIAVTRWARLASEVYKNQGLMVYNIVYMYIYNNLHSIW